MFATYYRDVEAQGNDYAQARTYVGGLGRFSSPDPISGSTSDPQSLNRYSYVRNMPAQLSDPFGTCPPVVQNHDPDQNQSQDSQSGGGPSIDLFADPANPPGQVGGQGDCQQAPWYYTSGGGDAWGGGGGGVSIDGGEAFDPGSAFGITGFGTDGAPVAGGMIGVWTPGDSVEVVGGETTYDAGFWTFIPIPGSDGGPVAGGLVMRAISRAQALLSNEQCAKFIAGDSFYDPANVLRQLTAGNPQYGNFQVAAIAPIQGTDVNATTTNGTPFTQTGLLLGGGTVTTPTATVTMNSNNLNWQYPAGNDFGVTQDTRNALTILHELGHAINFLSGGLGSSGIIQDGPQVPGGMILSMLNIARTIKNCLN